MSTDRIEVTNIKFRAEQVTIMGLETNGAHKARVSLVDCPDKPSARFKDALAAVQEDVLKMTGIKGDGFVKAFSLYGVGVDTDKHGHHGFTFMVSLTTAWGTAHLALPRLRERVDDESGAGVLSDVTQKRVGTLLAAAADYYAQDREQQVLPLDGAASASGGE